MRGGFGPEQNPSAKLRWDLPVVSSQSRGKVSAMDKNRIQGKLEKAKGAVKESAGRILGNERLRAEGRADKAKGQFKDAAGKAADAAREAIGKASDALRKSTRH
jgi:uncharacterized protein YjbJ (UPF0337 family)